METLIPSLSPKHLDFSHQVTQGSVLSRCPSFCLRVSALTLRLFVRLHPRIRRCPRLSVKGGMVRNSMVGIFALWTRNTLVAEVALGRTAATHLQLLSPFHPVTVFHLPRSSLTRELPFLRSEESLSVTERRLQAIFLPPSFLWAAGKQVEMAACQFWERRNLCIL